MKYILFVFLIATIQLAAACKLNCISLGEKANCNFSTTEDICEVLDMDSALIQEGIVSSSQVVNILLDFHPNVTHVDLRFKSTPRQRTTVGVTREQFDVVTLYLIGKFEIPERNWFKNFPRVKLLVLVRVLFPTGIPIFTALRQVTRIYSDKTEISGFNLEIGDDFISGLPSLDFLYFRTINTGIINIGSDNAFSGLNALTNMNLLKISFSNVGPNILTPLVNLKSFVVIIGQISDANFLQQSKLSNIEEINLAYNNVNSLEAFGDFPKLTKLALFDNEVSDLVRSDFKGMKTLRALDLQSNLVRIRDGDVFYELRDIQTINLINNQISTISPIQFEHLQSLHSVDLSGNNLICDCSLKWVSEVSEKYGINFEGQCTDGINNGKLITDATNYANCVESFALECFNRSNSCRDNSRCISYMTTFLCPCIGGYDENSDGACVDVDECARGTANCEHACSNLPGTYECCPKGHKQGRDGYCIDLDECLDPSNNICDQECLNTEGSYTCKCLDGYKLSANGSKCADIDECAQVGNSCKYKCENALGSYQCECPSGYQLDTDGITCYDGNNCVYNNAECKKHCIGVDGELVCVCEEGFVHKEVNGIQSCVNSNECEIPNICSQGCEDSIGSYQCLCDAGSRLANDSHTCVDIDECSEGVHYCESLEHCENEESSYNCYCKFGHFIEGTNQCGFLPVYGYYVVGGGSLVILVCIVTILCILCLFFICKRQHLRKSKKRLDRSIYKEISLQRTARAISAYDPMNNLQQAIDEDSRPSTAQGYERMSGENRERIYDTIEVTNSKDAWDDINADTQLIHGFYIDS